MIAPPNTGTANKSKNAVTNIAQINKGILWRVIPGVRIFNIVVIKLRAPKIDEAPAKWREKIAISTAGPAWPNWLESGG